MHQPFICAVFPVFPFFPIVLCRRPFFQTDKIDLADVLFAVADNIPHIPVPDTGIGDSFRTGRSAVQTDLTPVPPVFIQFLQKRFLCSAPLCRQFSIRNSLLPFSCCLFPELIGRSHIHILLPEWRCLFPVIYQSPAGKRAWCLVKSSAFLFPAAFI